MYNIFAEKTSFIIGLKKYFRWLFTDNI